MKLVITQRPSVGPNDNHLPDDCAACGRGMASINIGKDGKARCTICHFTNK